MEAKHTPGPWAVWPMGDILAITCTGKDSPHPQEGMHIAHVSLPNEQHLQWVPTFKANARLIAAAPELLADLTAAAAQLRQYETLHRAKNTEDSLRKAEVNAELAARFEQTIAKATS